MEGMTLPVDNKRGPNCGLTAMAVACGVTLAEAKEAYLKALGRKPGSRWGGGTYSHLRRKAIQDSFSHLVSLEGVPHPYGHNRTRNIGLKAWMKRYAKPGVTYIVTTTGHVQVVRDGLVMDQTTPEPITPERYFRRANKHVTDILAVTYKTQEDPAFGPAELLTIPLQLRRVA